MATVRELAQAWGWTELDVLQRCQSLGIPATGGDSELDDDALARLAEPTTAPPSPSPAAPPLAPPPAASSPPGAGVPPASQRSGMSGAMKALLIVLGVLVLLFGGCVAAVVLLAGSAENVIDEVSRELDESFGVADPADYEIDLASCDADPAAGSVEASGTITNTSDRERSFGIEVSFEEPDGTLVERNTTVVDALGPGQDGRWSVTTLDDAPEGSTCEVVEVRNNVTFGD